MRYKSRPAYRNWGQVTADVKAKQIAEGAITNETFLSDIETIAHVSQGSFFNGNGFDEIIDDINQISYYDPVRAKEKPEVSWAFIEDLHKVAELIREVKRLPGSKKLLRSNIFSHAGMYMQFLITAYLGRTFNILDMEVNNRPFNSDIILNVEDRRIHLSVKDCREEHKRDRAEDAVWAIDSVFTDMARANRDEHYLAVKSFSASPPASVDESYWIEFAKQLEEKPQVQKVTFKKEDGYGLSEDLEINIELEWREWVSRHDSPLNSIHNERKLISLYNDWEEKAGKYGTKGEIYLLAGITDDEYDWEEFEESLKDQNAGLILFSIHGYYFQHSPFMLPSSESSLAKILNNTMPSTPYWTFGESHKL